MRCEARERLGEEACAEPPRSSVHGQASMSTPEGATERARDGELFQEVAEEARRGAHKEGVQEADAGPMRSSAKRGGTAELTRSSMKR